MDRGNDSMRRRRNGLSSHLLAAAAAIAIALQLGCAAWPQPEARIGADADRLLPFGNPSNAAADAADRNNFLIVRSTYVLSYNDARGTANWAAWRLTAADLGESIPRPDFEPDGTLPAGFTRVTPSDYSGSGFDRGHLVPSADRFADPRANAETFLMTNVVPQTGDLNRNPWEKLERYSRSLARRGNTLYIFAGVYGERGERLRGKVTVPRSCWKVILVLPRSDSPDTVVRGDTRVIAVDMPNRDGIADANWRQYLTTVREIERRTGLDLFSALPRDVQDAIETRLDPVSRLPATDE
ncbi:MAG: DNA/RNA non-specific endonuclease [Pyrinomonadaceae bacterium]